MSKPMGFVLYGESIPVLRANGKKDALEPWAQTALTLGEVDSPPYGWVLESDPQEVVEPTEDGHFIVAATGETLK